MAELPSWETWKREQKQEIECLFPRIGVRLWNAFFHWNKINAERGKPLVSFQTLLHWSDKDLLRFPWIGPKTLEKLRMVRPWADPEWDAWALTLPGWTRGTHA